MNSRRLTSLSLLLTITNALSFVPSYRKIPMRSSFLCATDSTSESPEITSVSVTSTEPDEMVNTQEIENVADTTNVIKSPPKKPKSTGAHKEGLLSPLVGLAKGAIGDDSLIKIRAKTISMHTDVIKNFVATYETPVGQRALKDMFTVADLDGDGKLDEEELTRAFSLLGFSWLKEKQVKGIMKRADKDNNGWIDYDEFIAEVPKTLKVNLVKLAKKNGGDMGLLV